MLGCASASEPLISKFDIEPDFQALVVLKKDDHLAVDNLKTVIAEKFRYSIKDIYYSPQTAELIQSNQEQYHRYVFQVVLRDQEGPHGNARKIIVVWLDEMKKIFKIFDPITVYPV